jgi:hypothetical protein
VALTTLGEKLFPLQDLYLGEKSQAMDLYLMTQFNPNPSKNYVADVNIAVKNYEVVITLLQ